MAELKCDAESKGEDLESSTLSELFDKCLQLWDNIEETELSTSDNEYQNIVKKAILMLENVTHMVNRVGMFSSNETIEEVGTSDLKFLLLPALLGYFNLKIQPTVHSLTQRLDQLLLAEEYFKDFLKRCRSYELPDVDIPEISDNDSNKSRTGSARPTNIMDFQQMSAQREAVVARYKKSLAMDKELNALKRSRALLEDQAAREYHLLLLKRWTFRALEELHSIDTEQAVVRSAGQVPAQEKSKKKPAPAQPFKPIILVRTELQKKVFGVGYPSIPAMTVDEFYRQRYPEAENEPAPSAPLSSLQQMASDPDAAAKAIELEETEEEEKMEKDDPEALQKARAFDDWKDENRRGCGNRMNMG